MTADPFGELGLAPTMDLGAIKRSYFTALRAHPPHSDPEGFARIRAAYESLQSSTGRAARVMSAPLDVDAALRALEARAPRAQQGHAEETGEPTTEDPEAASIAAAAFVRGLVVLPLGSALEHFRASRKPLTP